MLTIENCSFLTEKTPVRSDCLPEKSHENDWVSGPTRKAFEDSGALIQNKIGYMWALG